MVFFLSNSLGPIQERRTGRCNKKIMEMGRKNGTGERGKGRQRKKERGDRREGRREWWERKEK